MDNLKFVDKEKVLDWFTNMEALSSSIGITAQELSSATKVVKDFENPTPSEKNTFVNGSPRFHRVTLEQDAEYIFTQRQQVSFINLNW